MRKLMVSLAIVFASLLGLSACGSSSSNNSDTSTSTSTTKAPPPGGATSY